MTIRPLSASASTVTLRVSAGLRMDGFVRAMRRTFSRASLAFETGGGGTSWVSGTR